MKKIISLFLSLMMLFSITAGIDFTAYAATKTLAQIQAQFPAGKYWNHAGSSKNNPDGVTSIPCTHHNPKAGYCSKNGTNYSGWCGCNSYNSSIQCHGFGLKAASLYYGSVPTSWSIVYNLNSLKAGDVVRYKNNGHTIWVTAVNGNTVTYGDCNSDGHCKIRWNQTISKSTISSTLTRVYSAPYKMNAGSSVHVHSYDTYVYYEKEHPHYKCYKCSCGEVKANYSEPTKVSSCTSCTTHVHSFDTYVYYEKAHPHYKCYKCSCGEVQRNISQTVDVSTCASCPSHVHSFDTFVYRWKEHPHYKCYECNCGEVKTNYNEPVKLDTCTTCTSPQVNLKNFEIKDTIIKGHSLEFSGDIKSDRGIKCLWVGILDENKNHITYFQTMPGTSSGVFTFDLESCAGELDYSKLSAGKYTFQIDCQDFDDNYFVVKKFDFTVKEPTMTVNGNNDIPDLKAGENYSLSGTIECDNGVYWVWVGILNSQNEKVTYYSSYLDKNNTVYDYTEMASKIDFSSLPAGDYLFAINAEDDDSNYYVPVKSYFSVIDSDSDTEHDYELKIVKEADCENSGLLQYVCRDCGKISSEFSIQPLGHEFAETKIISEATCTTDGSYVSICSRCNKEYDEHIIERTGHSYIIKTTFSDGRTLYECSNCNDTYIEEVPFDLSSFKIKTVSLSLESSITMNYKVLKSAVADFENPYIEFTRNDKTTTVTDYTEQGDYYVFSYRDIAPQAMNDTVQAVLYATYNDVLYNSEPVDFSVAQYAYGMLDKCGSNQYARLRTLLVDLLNYGAAAQIYQNYKTDDLVNADLTDTQKSWASTQELNLTNVTDKACDVVENPAIEWKSVGLQLNNSVAVRYKFAADDVSNIQLKVTCGNSEWMYGVESFIDNGDGTYSFIFNNLNADKMQKDIYITAMNGDTAVSNTMRYSVESYAKQVQDSMPNSNLRKLTDAMMRYGISASNYI